MAVVGNARSGSRRFRAGPSRRAAPTLAPLSSGVIFDLTSSGTDKARVAGSQNNQIINIFVPIMV